MNGPYREPGVPPGRLIHRSVRFLLSKEESMAIQIVAAQDGYQPGDEDEWVYQTVLKVLREHALKALRERRS